MIAIHKWMNLDSSLFLTAPHSPSKWQSHCVRNRLEQHLRSVCLTLILRTAIPSPPFMARMWGVSLGIFYCCQVEISLGIEPRDCQVGLSQHADADSSDNTRVEILFWEIFRYLSSSRQRQHVSNELRHCTRRKIFLKKVIYLKNLFKSCNNFVKLREREGHRVDSGSHSKVIYQL